jgi:hypothetical protein
VYYALFLLGFFLIQLGQLGQVLRNYCLAYSVEKLGHVLIWKDGDQSKGKQRPDKDTLRNWYELKEAVMVRAESAG